MTDSPLPGTPDEALPDILADAAPFEAHEIYTIYQRQEEPDAAELDLARQLRNDIGNAGRLRKRFGWRLLMVKDIGWHVWTGQRWDGVRGEIEAQRLAHRTARAIFAEAKALACEGPQPVMEIDKKTGEIIAREETPAEFTARVDSHRKWATTSGNSPKLKAMLEQSAPDCTVKVEELDADPWVLNLPNGVLDLRNLPKGADAGGGDEPGSGGLMNHDPLRLISKIAGAAYDPDAGCPIFDAFLARILPDASVRLFLQRWFGYSLSGSTAEQCLVFLYGTGSNGKSTLVEVIMRVLGDYAMTLNFSSLYHDDRKRGSDATPDIAQLPGARMVLASEPEAGVRFSEALIKTLTGDARIKARNLNLGFFDFAPEFKLTLAGNHKPSVRGQDEGIWRRVNLVPFDVQVPKAERDKRLPEKLKAEYPGILNWLLDGLRMYLEDGLQPPEAVAAATEKYRSESDPIGQFLAEETRPLPGSHVQATALHGRYCDWAKANAIDAVSATLFGRRLRDRGYESTKMGVNYWVGLELLEPRSPAGEEGGQPSGAG